MEFHEKLQALRKQKGLTQEELAAKLFVSRTAVSKWESGRGYPNIDSLKALAKFFSVTVDELLSGEDLLSLAREEQQEKENQCRGYPVIHRANPQIIRHHRFSPRKLEKCFMISLAWDLEMKIFF